MTSPELYPAQWLENGQRRIGYIDSAGAVQLAVSANAVFPFCEGAARIKRDGRFGVIDQTGATMVECAFASATDYRFGLSVVSPDGVVRGLIDQRGNWKLRPAKRELVVISRDLYSSKEDGDAGWYLRRLQGEKCAGPYEFPPDELRCGRILTREDSGIYRFLDTEGRLAIKRIFTKAFPFGEEWALVCTEDKWRYINTEGDEKLQFEFDECPGGSRFNAGLAPVGQLRGRAVQYLFIDKTGEVVVGPYAAIKEFTPYGAAAKDLATKAWGLIDGRGKWVLRPEWFLVDSFVGQLARAFREAPIRGKVHFVNADGAIVWVDNEPRKR